MRRHKPDRPVTRLMFREGYFFDERSFVSLPDGDDCESHVFLAGVDWSNQKAKVWSRDHSTCQICGRNAFFSDPDHVVKRSKGGSDDIGNLRTVCRDCHKNRHPEKRTYFHEAYPADRPA